MDRTSRSLLAVARTSRDGVCFDIYPPFPREPETMRAIVCFLLKREMPAWIGSCEEEPRRVLMVKPTPEQLPELEAFLRRLGALS